MSFFFAVAASQSSCSERLSVMVHVFFSTVLYSACAGATITEETAAAETNEATIRERFMRGSFRAEVTFTLSMNGDHRNALPESVTTSP